MILELAHNISVIWSNQLQNHTQRNAHARVYTNKICPVINQWNWGWAERHVSPRPNRPDCTLEYLDHPGTNHGTHFPCIFRNGCVKEAYDSQGLCSFQTLRTKFCLPASAYFVFLQLRSALKAYGVPWASSISSHPMRDWIAPSAGRPSVSLIYNKIIDCITKPLSIKTIWNRELSDLIICRLGESMV